MLGQRIKRAIKAVLFAVIALVLLIVCNFIAQPIWSMASYNSAYGIYEEPDNTIETLFVGTSHVHNGISPMQLYEEYGICSYDISTEAQPMLASYYWIEEVYRKHSDTLDTVVLDVSSLRYGATYRCQQAIDPMRFSAVKLRAVKSYSTNFTDFLNNLFPIFSYHERWKELGNEDFQKFNYEPQLYLRGYVYTTSRWIENVDDFTEISTPLCIPDENEEEKELPGTCVEYFEKMVSFCEDHNIRLILIKTPTVWTSADHNAIQALADKYSLDFLDFNIEPYYSDIQFNLSADVINPSDDVNNLHLNYYGATKLTEYLGEYLVNECGNRDVREDEKYAFMDEELADYQRYTSLSQSLLSTTDPCDYMKLALNEGECTVFISVKDDAANSLTEEQRAYFESIGLKELSQLTYGSSYLAVIDDGSVTTEQYQRDLGSENSSDNLIRYSGILQDGTAYTLVSGGYHMGDTSSILIGDTERSDNKRGLNIAIYDNKLQRYVGKASFDTCAAPERVAPFNEQTYKTLMKEGATPASLTDSDRILYLYDRECENEKTAALARQKLEDEEGLLTYLQAFWDDDDVNIYITAQGDAAGILTDDLRASLSDLGLAELSQLTSQDSYVAVVCGGKVELEERDEKSDCLKVSSKEYSLTSAGEVSENGSSVTIDGIEYSDDQEGIYIVIYDQITKMVVDTITFAPVAESLTTEVLR